MNSPPLPDIIVIDSNFIFSLCKTRNIEVVSVIKTIFDEHDIEVYTPMSAIAEVKGKDMHCGLQLEKLAKTKVVEKGDFYNSCKEFSSKRHYISEDEEVDFEVIALAYDFSKINNMVGLVTYDKGIIDTIYAMHLDKQIKIIYPWNFLIRLIPLCDSISRETVYKAANDVCNYFYEYRVKKGREISDLINSLIENAAELAELSAEMRASMSKLILVANKYLDGILLNKNEQKMISDIIPLLNTIKMAKNATSLDKMEEALSDVVCNLIMLWRNKKIDRLDDLIELANSSTMPVRLQLAKKYIDAGNFRDAIMHLELLRTFYLYHKENVELKFLSKIHSILALLNLLERKNAIARNYINLARSLAQLDELGKITELLIFILDGDFESANTYIKDMSNNLFVFHLLMNLAHVFALKRNYNLAANLLLLGKSCNVADPQIIEEKAIVILRSVGNSIDEATKATLENLIIDKRNLIDNTKSPIDKNFLGQNIQYKNLSVVFKEKMPVLQSFTVSNNKMLLVLWNFSLKSRIGMLLSSETHLKQARNALNVVIRNGMIKQVKNPTPKEKRDFKIRLVIVPSESCQLDVTKWALNI